jgi:poly-gamma-glutamate capsule biosynthesis protein CapA/YwtB (metallophosphatase superfamily)
MGSLLLHCVGDVYASEATLRDLSCLDAARDVLRCADVRFANLEAPLVGVGRPLFSTGVRLRMPPSARGMLELLGIDVVTLANNHLGDYGPDGVRSTLRALGSIRAVGAGADAEEAARPAFLEARGLRLAFLAACDDQGGGAGSNPGVNLLRPARLIRQVREARARADHVVVGIHTGIEFSTVPEPFFVALAHRLVDAGASVVAGHHPHVPQGVVSYRGGVIAYSLGDFAFDLSRDGEELSPEQRALNGLHPILEVALEKAGVAGHQVHWLRREAGRYMPAPDGPALGAKLDALASDPEALAREAARTYGRECFEMLYGIYSALYLAARRGEWGRLGGLAWWLPTLAREPKRRALWHGLAPALAIAARRLRGGR